MSETTCDHRLSIEFRHLGGSRDGRLFWACRCWVARYFDTSRHTISDPMEQTNDVIAVDHKE